MAPIPKPAPERTELAIAGTNVSRIENVHAATNANVKISSRFNDFLGTT